MATFVESENRASHKASGQTKKNRDCHISLALSFSATGAPRTAAAALGVGIQGCLRLFKP